MVITKSQKALLAIKIISKYLKKELLTLIISNYYSIIFYNSEIWLIPALTHQKNMLMSASASPPKICCPAYDNFISFEHLHNILKRPVPSSIAKYNHDLLLHLN